MYADRGFCYQQCSGEQCTNFALSTRCLLLVFAVAVLRSIACLRMACMRAVWYSRHHFPGCTVPWLETCTRGICAVGNGSAARGIFEWEELHGGECPLCSRELGFVKCTSLPVHIRLTPLLSITYMIPPSV